MFEYKVDIYKVKYAEDALNTYAREGWRVIAVTPDHITGFVDVFFEREISGEPAAADSPAIAENAENAVIAGAAKTAEPEEQIGHIDPSEYPEDPDKFNTDIWDFAPEGEETESEE